MIPKSQKFNMRVDFLSFKSHCKKTASNNLIIYYDSSKNENLQLAVVVPKKSISKAAKRNQYKRTLKQTLLNNTNSGVFIVLVKPIPLTISPSDLKQELISVLSRLS